MNGKISQGQLFTIAMLFGLTDILSFAPCTADAEYNFALWFSLAAAFVIRALLLLPAYILYKKEGSVGFVNLIRKNMSPRAASLVLAACAVLLAVCACGDNIKFCYFTVTCPVPDISVTAIAFIMAAGGIYCALKGREAVVRGGAAVAALIFIGMLFVITAMCTKTDWGAFATVMYNFKGSLIAGSAVKVISGSISPAVVFFLLYDSEGKSKRYFWLWNGLITVMGMALAFVTTCRLGALGVKMPFPVYSAVNAASFGFLERFDAIYMCALALGSTVRLAVIFMLFYSFAGKKNIWLTAAFVVAVFVAGTAGRNLEAVKALNNVYLRLAITVVPTVLIPTALLIKRRNNHA